MMDNPRCFEQNLSALSRRQSSLYARLSQERADDGRRYQFLESRSGEIVPALIDQNGVPHPLHSLVDPRREAARLLDAGNAEGFLIFLGLGGGFSLSAALEREETQRVLVIEYGAQGLAELLNAKAYSPLFQDPRFYLLLDPPGEEIERRILEDYQPVLAGGIRVIPLRARVEGDQPLFSEAGNAINQGISTVSRDYSVQAYFGTRWFSNTLRNLIRAEEQDGPIPSIRRAAITAAGPSLDIQMPLIARKRRDFFLLATDTSLPGLLQAGLEPDAVVSIDCQHISYYHFMSGLPESVPLYLDLASPPLVASRSGHPRFFSGGHPFTRYISKYWRPLPLVDTSGGNVTYAALSLADMLGAEQIELYGADFSYPQGRTYSRGAYIYPYFEIRQNRLGSLEALFSDFLFRSPDLKRIRRDDLWYYETPTLTRYRTMLEEKTGCIKPAVLPVKGLGAGLNIKTKEARGASHTIRLFAPGSSSMRAKDFIFEYGRKIRELPAMGGPAWSYLRSLDNEEALILTTQLPTAAAMKRRNPRFQAGELIEAVRDYCLGEIDKVLRTPPD
jgi:hypothetical protein